MKPRGEEREALLPSELGLPGGKGLGKVLRDGLRPHIEQRGSQWLSCC